MYMHRCTYTYTRTDIYTYTQTWVDPITRGWVLHHLPHRSLSHGLISVVFPWVGHHAGINRAGEPWRRILPGKPAVRVPSSRVSSCCCLRSQGKQRSRQLAAGRRQHGPGDTSPANRPAPGQRHTDPQRHLREVLDAFFW